MQDNEGSKCSFAVMVILSSLPSAEIMWIWHLSLGGSQGRLLGAKWPWERGTKTLLPTLSTHAFRSQDCFFPIPPSLILYWVKGSWCALVWRMAAAAEPFGFASWKAMVLELQQETETLARMQGRNSIPKSDRIN